MQNVLGAILVNAGTSVRSICFDNAQAHNSIKLCLLGVPGHEAAASVPFFGELRFEPLPFHEL